MDIRKKGVIALFIYNILGLLAVCSISPSDPLYSEGWLPVLLFTFPVTVISFGYRYGASEPLYPVFIIQFIMLIISTYLVDLILRNYSPTYIEKKRAKYINNKKKESTHLITEQQVSIYPKYGKNINNTEKESIHLINQQQVAIYLKYGKNINDFTQTATPEEKAALSVEQWYTIDNLASDILLLKRGQVLQSTINSVGKRIKDKLKDQATMDLLLTIE